VQKALCKSGAYGSAASVTLVLGEGVVGPIVAAEPAEHVLAELRDAAVAAFSR